MQGTETRLDTVFRISGPAVTSDAVNNNNIDTIFSTDRIINKNCPLMCEGDKEEEVFLFIIHSKLQPNTAHRQL